MSKQFLVYSSTVLFALGGWLSGAQGLEPGGKAQMRTFSHPDGKEYFALSLSPGAVAPSAKPRDVVVLFDTSASQAGDYRTDGLAALRDALKNLSPTDRVKLIAVDLHASPMTEGFAAPNSPEMAQALDKLQKRVPLGSTDMEKALAAAADSYAGSASDAQHGRAAIYIGDGMSAANLLGTEQFEKLAERLVNERVPVSSCPVGPRVDRQLLGALAGNTGGRIVEMGPQSGNELARAADTPVIWPSEKINWPQGFEAYPRRMPPLRADRDSVVIGTFSGKGPFDVQMTADGPNGPEKLSWNVKPAPSNEDDNYLGELVSRAKVDGGVSLPLVGSKSLDQARQEINVGVRGASRLARQALAADDLDNADRLANEALRQDPNNPEAIAVKGAVAKKRAGGPAAGGAAPAGGLPPAGGEIAGGPGGGDVNLWGAAGAGAFNQGGFAAAFGQETKVVEQVIQTQVQNAVNQARAQMSKDPEGAKQNLKVTLETVRQTPDLNPEIRDQLVDVIQAALRLASRKQVELEQKRQQTQENLAQAKERMLVNENLLRKQQKVRQLMERFNSLMDEGKYRVAEEAAASEVAAEIPDSPIGVAATLWSRQSGYLHDAMVLRVARQKGVVDALYQVEKSHVPTADEPPIVYPESHIWQELSARRKEKYSSMDLASRGTAEKKIDDALKSPTQLEFIETPLQDVIDYLKDFHDIEIQIDKKALDDVGIGSDTPITKNLKGISLRSALRLTLRELDLTYVIQDEVLLITTPEQAETLAAPHSQVEAAHHFGIAIFFCQAAYLQHGQASRNACFSSFSLPWKKCPASGMAFTASCCCSAHSRIAVGGMSSSASPKITIVSGGTGSNSYMVTAGATRIRRFAWSSWRSRCCTKAPNEKPANAHGRPG